MLLRQPARGWDYSCVPPRLALTWMVDFQACLTNNLLAEPSPQLSYPSELCQEVKGGTENVW